MAAIVKTTADVPIRPSTSVFAEYELLLMLCECWEQARGDKMIPTKQDFMEAMLEHPEILPDMTLVEKVSSDAVRHLYLGSERVFRQNRDRTYENVLEAFAPNARQFVMAWSNAIFERPLIAFCKDRTQLPSGTMTETPSLTVVLSNDEGQPTCQATASVVDKATTGQELQRGGFLNGSGGMDVVPIDIGLGVPDLPRTVGITA